MIADRDDDTTARAKHSRIGPLAFHLDGFAALLCREGYASKTVHEKRALLADLSRWLDRHGVPLDALDEKRFKRFLADRRRRGKERRIEAMTGRQLLGYLRDLDCIPALPQKIDRSPVGELTQDFERFLRSERGLSSATSANYLPVVRRFLIEHFGRRAMRLDELRPIDIHRFILRHAEKGSRRTAQLMVSALRSFLRFLQQRGVIVTDLAGAVPAVACWRLAHLPKSLPPEQVERLLSRCDRNTPTGRRDYAYLAPAGPARVACRGSGRHDFGESRLGARRDCDPRQGSAAGTITVADRRRSGAGGLPAPCSSGLLDPPGLCPHACAAARIGWSRRH